MSHPGAQSTLSPSKGNDNGARLRKPVPVPVGLRPKKSDNQLPVLNLIHVPKRILVPPKSTGFASVRSFKTTPLSDIRLANVIAGKHLSPLSLKDFEGYLAFTEHSAENLYCLLWMNEYTKEWKQWQANTGSRSAPGDNQMSAALLPPHLAEYLRRGLDTFFATGGPLELNLSSKTRGTALVAAGNSGNPDDFTEARDIIEHSLKRSLAIHARNCVANAGPRRLVFCFSLGMFIFLLGLIAPLVGILGNHARGYRAIGLPFICFGASVSVMALKRICGVIWLLGEDRQLLPNELAPPKLTSSSLVSLGCPSTPSSTYSTWDSESTYSSDKGSDSLYPWEEDEKVAFGDAGHTTVSFSADPEKASSRPPSYRSGGGKDLVPASAPVFGPITKVYSSDVARAQWALVIQSLLWGTLVMVIVGSVLMAVPNRA